SKLPLKILRFWRNRLHRPLSEQRYLFTMPRYPCLKAMETKLLILMSMDSLFLKLLLHKSTAFAKVFLLNIEKSLLNSRSLGEFRPPYTQFYSSKFFLAEATFLLNS